MTEQLPVAVGLNAFLNLPVEERPPLLGTNDQALVAAGGLVLIGGKAGLGKTTLIVDAIFHLASGLPWLTFPAPRPLNILVIENEGPLRMFQQKLAAKAKAWQHELTGQIHVQTGAWGYFSFNDLDHHTSISAYLDEHQIDLVIGDPIGTLGMEGVGSPEDTRNFVKLLVPLGLLNNRAFIFPVHFTKEPRKDEIDQISGAWGGHLDTLMVLKSTGRKDELRLSFPKLRWWNNSPPAPIILGKVYNTHTFEILRHEGDEETPLEHRITKLLDDGTWRTAPEIAHKESGIGVRRETVQKTLESRSDLFRFESGADHGKSARAAVWQLVPTSGTSTTSQTQQPSQQELVPTTRDEWDEYEPEQDYDNSSRHPGTSGTSSENGHQGAGEEHVPAPTPVGGSGTSTERHDNSTRPDHGSSSQPDDDLDALFGEPAKDNQ